MYLKTKHKVFICPIFMTHWKMNEDTLQLISRISNNTGFKNTQVTFHGPVMHCPISTGKRFIFQSQLTKVQSSYTVEMKLIETYQKLPIKVHFNVRCKELNNYHTSFHPRTMTTNWNNTCHVTLPFDSVQQKQNLSELSCCGFNESASNEIDTMTVEISIMMHNADEFGADLTDVNSIDKTAIISDMTSTAATYTFPNILSTFYGISNSVISILDSVSDIGFIVLLFSLNEIDKHEGYVMETEQIANFLIVLCIANLASVASVLAFYLTSKIEQKSRTRRIAIFFTFFILSPCLPAMRWVIERFQNNDSDRLVISPNYDGLLLWFEQELRANELFILE
eukprot:20391_1